MWPFGRTRDKTPSREPQPAPAPVIRRDWTALPPIQRTVGEHPLTAPSDRFSHDLATHHDPSVSSDQMGHQVSADAPPGIVLTVARTASTRSDGPAMIPRPRQQRRVEDAASESGEWDGDEAAPVETRPDPVPAVIQRTALVERPVVEPIAELPPLTTLPLEVDPVPVSAPVRRPVAVAQQAHEERPVQRRVQVEESVASAPRLTLGQARRLGLGAPITKVPERAIQRAAVEAAPAIEPAPSFGTPSPGLPSAVMDARPTPPSSSPVQRAASDPVSPIPATGLPPISEGDGSRLDLPLAPAPITHEPNARVDETTPGSHDASPEPSLHRFPSSTLPAPMTIEAKATVQRAADPAAEVAVMTPSASQGDARTPSVQRSAAAVPSGNLPLASKPLMRSALHGATDEAAGAGPPSPASSVSPSSLAPFTSPTHASDAPLISARPIATLQRSSEPAPATNMVLQTPPLSTEASGGPPEHRDTSPTARPLPVVPVGIANIAGPSTRTSLQRSMLETSGTPTLTLSQSGRESRLSGGENLAGAPTLTLPQRGRENRPGIREDSALPLAPTVIQRVSEPSQNGAQPVSEPPASLAAFLVQRTSWDVSRQPEAEPAAAPAPAPSPPAAADRSSERDMDELAGKLYDRIRSKLRAELLVDRERAGLLTDWR